MTRTELEPWERQPSEGEQAFASFAMYRDMLPKRSTGKVALQCGKHVRLITRWSARWWWVERCREYDRHVDRQHREKLIQSQLEARERHARLAQATLTVLSLPVKAALEAARDPALVQKMVEAAGHGPAGSYQLLAAIARVASVIPSVVTMERLALGLTTESVDVEEKREFDVEFTNRILASSEATDLVIQVLHSVASGAGPPPALGTGASGEPRQAGDGSASEPADEEVGGP